MQASTSTLYIPEADPFIAPCPVCSGKVSAGQSRFPSPAQDYEMRDLDLNQHLIKKPATTFFTEVTGDSMIEAGIFPGSLLIVDMDLKPKSSDIVIVLLDGELMVKRLYKRGKIIKLLSENSAYQPIEMSEGQELIVWGVVTYVITSTK